MVLMENVSVNIDALVKEQRELISEIANLAYCVAVGRILKNNCSSFNL